MRILLIFTLVLCFSVNVLAQDLKGELARLESAEGKVEALLAGSKEFITVAVGQTFKQGETIRTFSGTKAAIVFNSGVLLRLAPGTSLTFQDIGTGTQRLSMNSGKGFFFSREPAQFPVINSPAVTTAVRGTEFVIEVDAKRTSVSVISGQVNCTNSYGAVDLTKGERADTEVGKAPVKSLLLHPEDAVQWVVTYPLLADSKSVTNPGVAKALSAAENALGSGDVERASAALAGASTGAEIAAHDQASVKAQRAVIELALNRRDQAKQLADQALAADSDSVPALMAAAYVAQGSRDLIAARDYLSRAVAAEPDNTQAALRLAELELAFANYDRAMKLIQSALEHNPADSYALTLRGFARLIKHQMEKARADFETALSTSPAMALARLGLGLTLIRGGDLTAGREELTKAVAYEPLASVYRSYLGKAFFEEYREGLAQGEFDKAIALDANDPTPYLYRAYSNLSYNRVVDALEDVEQSIALNNNRAVYRSSMLLDQDLGVRSASLSEVFASLGFEQAARIEAIKSINKDYSNYSAHQLLANNYNTILLNDAGQSERQISSLLAPLSFNLFSSGSSAPSLNEYTSLFDRDQSRTEVSFEGSSYDDFLNPAISTAGKYGEWGYFVGLDSISTDGSKDNNYERRHSAETLLQYEIDSDNRLALQANGLYRKRVDSNQLAEDVRFENYSVALGYRSQLAPQLSLLAESRFSNDHSRFLSPESERLLGLLVTIDGQELGADDLALLDDLTRESVQSNRNTLQLVYDSDTVSTVWGVQAYFADIDRREDSPVIADELGFFEGQSFDVMTAGSNALDSFDNYLYSTLHVGSDADLTAGFSYTDLELEDQEVTPFLKSTRHDSRVSPKLGVSVYPMDNLTVRAAYFEGLRKSSLENSSSLEPTLVGGINQVFNDLSGARSRSWAGGVDYKLPSSSYLGVEAIARHVIDLQSAASTYVNLDQEGLPVDSFAELDSRFDLHSDQDIYRAYYYQVWNSRFVSTMDYQFINVERTDPEIPQDYDLHRAIAGLRYFDPSGWFTFLTGTWRQQERQDSDFFGDGTDSFWIVDAGMGYRLPHRSGSLTLEFNNILDESFTYDQIFGLEEFVRQDFGVTLKASFNF